MTLFEDLKWRGLIHNLTDEGVINLINEGKATFYLGTDPTGDSLHVGHLLVFLLAKRLEKYGNKPILLIGGATGFIGDPKPTSERQLLDENTIKHNVDHLYNQVSNLFKCDMVNNYDWTHNIDLLSFLRKYGKFFNVAYMINKDTVKSRLESGISYTEFSYQILQALDFEHLFSEKKCNLQIGGQDQWGNITSGLELIRKIHGSESVAYGLTAPLFTKSDGTKFGKSEGGAIWLDPDKTSPYQFYQFWLNTKDADVMRCLKQFTFLSKEEIEEIEESFINEPHLRVAGKALAKEMTVLIHGEDAYIEAQKLSDALFTGKIEDLTAKQIEDLFNGVKHVDIDESMNLVDLLVLTTAASSKREARDFVNGGGVYLNGVQKKDISLQVNKEIAIESKYTVIRRGKKNYYLVKHNY